MTPERTHGTKGSYRFDEVIPGVGRLRIKSGAKTKGEHHTRVALVRRLRDRGRLDLLTALRDGAVSILELIDADRRDALPAAVGDLALQQPLWGESGAVLRSFGATSQHDTTERRYRLSFAQLLASGALPGTATVADLGSVDWVALEATWGRSAADWNHLRRAVSRLLTLATGSRWHPVRVKVLKGFPLRRELPRMPDVSPADFRRALTRVPDPLQPAIMVMAMFGLRIGEFLALRPHHIGATQLTVPGTKTVESARTLSIDPPARPWLQAAVPCPVSRWALRRHWRKATTEAGLAPMRLHDLRHCTAQWLANAGRPLTSLQALLGHKSLEMTARYAKRRHLLEDAKAMTSILLPQVDPQVRKRAKGRRSR